MDTNNNIIFFDFENLESDLSDRSRENFAKAVPWSTDWTTETLISQLNKGNINLNPNFQRRDAWGDKRKSEFIESIFLNLPIPQIILAEDKNKKGAFIVIDGKQRLLTLKKFSALSNDEEFPPLRLKDLQILPELNEKTFQEIIETPKLSDYVPAFENHIIRTVILKNWPDENYLYTIFLRLNTGSLPLSPQELRQALNPGSFTNFVDEFSIQSEAIKKALKIEKADYRMRDVELTVRFLAFKNFFENYKANLKDFLDSTSSYLNHSWEFNNGEHAIKQQVESLEKAILGTIHIFGEDAFRKYSKNDFSRPFNKAVFDIMVFYFSESLVLDQAIKHKSEVIEKFKTLCLNDLDFFNSFGASAKDIDPIIKRYNTWGNALKEMFKLDFKIPTKTDKGIKLT